jgi:hypothetical protein
MADTFFETYEQAASYAKQCAQKSGQPVKLERINEEWVVYAPQFSLHPVSNSKPLPNPPPWFKNSFGQESGVPGKVILAQERLEREQRQREYADQKSYDETIKKLPLVPRKNNARLAIDQFHSVSVVANKHLLA